MRDCGLEVLVRVTVLSCYLRPPTPPLGCGDTFPVPALPRSLAQVTKSVAIEQAKSNVQINAIAHGLIDSDM